jgi:HlyD family secretion protein
MIDALARLAPLLGVARLDLRSRRVWSLTGLVVSLGLCAAGCYSLNAATPAQHATPAPRAVRVGEISLRRAGGDVSASGYLVARDEVDVGPEVAGYRVIKILVDEGALVSAGQPLAVLDDSLLRAQIDQQSALVAQQATLAREAEAEAGRVKSLQGKGVLSDEALQGRLYKAEAAQSAAKAQEAQLEDLEVKRAHLVVRAPVSGLILQRDVKLGDLATLSSAPMFRIARDGQIELDAQTAEDNLYRIAIGDPCDVVLSDGAHLTGSVRAISPRVDPQTRLGDVRVALRRPIDPETTRHGLPLRGLLTAEANITSLSGRGPKPPPAAETGPAPGPGHPTLRVGAFAAAHVNAPSASVAWAPEAAVRYDPDGAAVMVLEGDNRVRKTPVKTGAHADGFVQLMAGPPAGTAVLLGAAAFVVDGEVVRPIRTATP